MKTAHYLLKYLLNALNTFKNYSIEIKQHISTDQEESSPYVWYIDEHLNDVLDIADNLADICNDMQAPNLSEFNFKKNYDWGHHETKVSQFSIGYF